MWRSVGSAGASEGYHRRQSQRAGFRASGNPAINDAKFPIAEVVSGGARGVDTMGETFAQAFKIPVKQFIPDWNTHGKKAGILRNIEMANYADALIAVWDGESKGTKQMIDYAKAKGLKVFVRQVPPAPLNSPT